MTESRRAAPARIQCKTDMLPTMAHSCFRPGAKALATASVFLAALPLTPLATGATSEPLPKSFTREWCAYPTEHFDLFTDLPHKRALRTINGLVRFRQMFLALFPEPHGEATLPLTMLVFQREREFSALTGTSRYAGVTLPSMHEYRVLAALGQRSAPTVNTWHEYAHYLLRNRADRSYPLWYEEGLASYLGAARLDGDPVRLGNVPRRQMAAIARNESVTFEAAIAATSVLDLTDAQLHSFYAKAWLLTHFIRHGHQSGYPDLRPALARYLDNPVRDFESAFGQPPGTIRALLVEYLSRRPLPGETLSLPKTRPQARQRACLGPSERDHMLGSSIIPINRPVAVRALEPLEPTARHLTALAQAVWDNHPRAMALVNQALAQDPANSEANVHLARLLVRGCAFSSSTECIGNWARAVDIYRAALERDPGRYDAAYGLGVAYLHTGRAPEAMQYLRLVYEKMPWSIPINFYLGEGYRIAGDPRAAAHLQNARNWTLDEAWRARAEFALRRLKDDR